MKSSASFCSSATFWPAPCSPNIRPISLEIAQTLVTIGVDLGKMNTVGDLQGGIEEAERLLGYKVVPLGETGHSAV
jgi:hypothetical protein